MSILNQAQITTPTIFTPTALIPEQINSASLTARNQGESRQMSTKCIHQFHEYPNTRPIQMIEPVSKQKRKKNTKLRIKSNKNLKFRCRILQEAGYQRCQEEE